MSLLKARFTFENHYLRNYLANYNLKNTHKM